MELPEYSSTYHVECAERHARDVLAPVALGMLVDVAACGHPGHVLALYAYARRMVGDLLATRAALRGVCGEDDARVMPVGEFVCDVLAAARRFTLLADDLGDLPLLFPLLRWKEAGGRRRQWATAVVAAQPAGQPMLVHVPRSPDKGLSPAATAKAKPRRTRHVQCTADRRQRRRKQLPESGTPSA